MELPFAWDVWECVGRKMKIARVTALNFCKLWRVCPQIVLSKNSSYLWLYLEEYGSVRTP
jgi:hypothetical protein